MLMPISYAVRNNLKDIDDNDDFLDRIVWYDDQKYLNEDDYIEVNTIGYLSLLSQKNDIISVIIKDIKELKIKKIYKKYQLLNI